MHYLYIIYSDSCQKFYIGETASIENRISKHHDHFYSNSFTKIANDWKIVLLFNCINKDEAVYLEKFIKRMKSKIFNTKIIDDPSILKDILSKRKSIIVPGSPEASGLEAPPKPE
ncbi:GIY-YIG nuclease family protein [Flavobacterium sp. ANB]|uniref:GIY-YIG nuclease family protein n=1 Tax=unclassified Flavobacterium TaxID=196869 RepID=UPI0012B93BC4|nr:MULTISPECIES: GIY-YIG nuclease family protein [unclassified Flavobacterium]MBF4514939.1 GIY-YIG nuclease family protein [Flavobacterium sp. ANB]MTD68265.1 GIY-YIG nuclease family protein [Flavobacterium sp. LC2016-13]